MNGGVRVPQPMVVLHGGGVALACALDGRLVAEELHGLFAADTRVLSTYRIGIGGNAWQLLGRSHSGHATAEWEFQNPSVRAPTGDIAAGSVLLCLRRRLDGVLHDDLAVRAYLDRPLQVRLSIVLDADFADIFQVKEQSLPPRPNILRVPGQDGLTLSYQRNGFRRGLRVRFEAPGRPPIFVGPQVIFDLDLASGAQWHCCLEAAPEVDGATLTSSNDPHGPEPSPVPVGPPLVLRTDPVLQGPFDRGRADLRALAVSQPPDPPYVAAGVPWFLTLFGRDPLVTALMAGLDGAWLAERALVALGRLQATQRDDWRDAEPGKVLHELRRGELANRGLIPHTPYFGSHDAPALYCLALWHAWRWTGDGALLDAHLATATAALRWCDELGDRDADGLLEYATRSSRGYRNQGWKDAGDAVVHEDGSQPALPLATVELQGNLFAARLAMAELLSEQGDLAEAERLEQAAWMLRALVEERFWLEDRGYYAFALDGKKRQVKGIASNSGQLLWSGLPSPARAATVAARLLQPDLFSGWGLRTLSALNPAYNPLSYQRGSVWPHDTALAAAGLWRYGLRDAASTLMRSILEAACAFEEERLPELFCGLERSHGLPVPYEAANSPQAWAAAVPLLATQLFLGLVPDAPRRRCYLSPWLPDWLPRLKVEGIGIGRGRLDVALSRRGPSTVIEHLGCEHLEVIEGSVEAPLWGSPPRPSHVAL